MNKPIKIFSVVLMMTLVSCGEPTQVNETEARAQVAAMKEAINKDDFVTPTCGMQKTKMTVSSGTFSFVTTTDLRFNVEKGSRYLYYKESGLLMNTEFYQYEKGGKYYCFSSLDTTIEEFSSEAEFAESFNEALVKNGVDVASIKSSASTFLDGVTNAYDAQTKPNSEYTVSYQYNFNKINDSSFTFDVTMHMVGDSSRSGSSKITIEVENYLPKKRYVEGAAAQAKESAEGITTEDFIWGSVDYVYPSKE